MSITPRQMLVPQAKWNIKCPYDMTPQFIVVHNCLPITTEVLTRTGWVSLDKIDIGDEIATVHQDDLAIEFGPVRYVQPIYLSPTIVAEHRGIEATENHRMLVTDQSQKQHKEMFMKDIRARRSAVYIPNAGFLSEDRGLPLSEWQIKLLVAIQADGSYIRCKYLGRHYDWTSVKIDVKKERKVSRLKDILAHLDYPYTEHFDGEYTSITIKGEEIKILCDTYLDNKVFNWSWLMMDQSQAELFIDELTYWDGSRVEHGGALERRYASSTPQNLDVVDAVAALNGIGTIRNKTIITFRRNLYRTLSPSTHYTTNITPVSCVTVDTGFILIRQNGVTTVVGNTANDASANNEISYMINNNNQVSYHFAVDDKEVVQGVLLNRNAWQAGDGGSGRGNRYGIGIEICYSLSGGERFDKAERLAAKFIAQLLKERNWGIDKVTKHQDYSGKYCLPLDATELLTPNGWTPLGDLVEGDLVAQWENGKIEFAPIQHVIDPYAAEVVKCRNIEATLNHDMVYRQSKSSDWKKDKWNVILDKYNSIIPVGGEYEGRGLPISDDYLRFLVWVQADGHYAKRTSKYTGKVHSLGIEFHFSKERKVKRLVEVLEAADQKYSLNTRSDGTYSIRIHDATKVAEVEQWLDNKQFSWKLLEMDKHQREVFLSEILLADGSSQNHSYFSTKQQNYDVVAAIAALNNTRSLQTTTGSSTALILSDTNLTVSKVSERQTRITAVSCVEVPSHNILVRQYGRPVVVGNCPHRTLDYGWSRFIGMVQSELNQLTQPAIEWIDDTPANYIAIADTALYNVINGQAVKTYPAGTQLEFVQHATHNGRAYYRTAYSRDKNIDNGMPITDFAVVEVPDKESIKWEDIDPIKFITGEDCNLLKIQTQEVVKTFQPGETLEFVQKCTYGGTVYYRTAYSKGKKVHNGVAEYSLLPYNDPGKEQPVEPDKLPEVEDPDPDQEYDEAMAKSIWVQLFDLVVKFIKTITGQKEK